MKSYSIDLRAKVLAAHDRGSKHIDIAQMFGVSQSWVRRVVQRRREHGELAPRARIGHHPVKVDRARLAALVAASPDATLAELRDRMGIDCSISAVWSALRQLGLSYKKRPSTPRSRIGPTSRNAGPSGSSGVPASTRLA